MAETAPKRGGFLTDRRLVADLTDDGCCGAPAETAAGTSSSCCGEPVAVVEPTEGNQGCGCCGETTTATAAPAAGCCA
jgi:hypothetical protein